MSFSKMILFSFIMGSIIFMGMCGSASPKAEDIPYIFLWIWGVSAFIFGNIVLLYLIGKILIDFCEWRMQKYKKWEGDNLSPTHCIDE